MSSCRRAHSWIPVVVACFLTSSSFIRSQEKGLEDLERDVTKKYRDILKGLLSGTIPGDDKNPEHLAALQAQAQYSTRRFADPVFVDTPAGTDKKNKTMDYLIAEAHKDLAVMMRDRAATQLTAKMYSRFFGESARDVILTRVDGNPVRALNLTRALADVALLGQGELADSLVDIIEDDLKKDQIPEAERLKDPKKMPNDGVKYYALRGLRDLMAQPPRQDGSPILTKEQELKVAKLLQKFVNITQTFKDGSTRYEIDGFRVRRREAVKALAQVGNPSVPDKKSGTGVTLLRVVARDDKLTPEPTIDERLEAAIGLARLKFDQDKDYNPDYAVYHIGLFVDEFVTFCNSEQASYQRPVHVYAARLIEALESINTQLNDPALKRTDAEKKYASAAIAEYAKVLGKIEKSSEGRVNPGENKLKDWLGTNKAPNTQLFKGLAETAVAPPKKKE